MMEEEEEEDEIITHQAGEQGVVLPDQTIPRDVDTSVSSRSSRAEELALKESLVSGD